MNRRRQKRREGQQPGFPEGLGPRRRGGQVFASREAASEPLSGAASPLAPFQCPLAEACSPAARPEAPGARGGGEGEAFPGRNPQASSNEGSTAFPVRDAPFLKVAGITPGCGALFLFAGTWRLIKGICQGNKKQVKRSAQTSAWERKLRLLPELILSPCSGQIVTAHLWGVLVSGRGLR